VAAYTFKNQFLFWVGPNIYLDGEKWNITGGVDAKWFPDVLYPRGRDSPNESESFTQRYFGGMAAVSRQVVSSFRVGAQVFAGHSELTEVEEGGLLDRCEVVGCEGGLMIGIGPSVQWDNRDQDTATWTGGRYELSALFLHGALGSDFDFAQFYLDVRHFFPLPRQHVLGLQAYAQLGFGDIPAQAAARLGGDSMMRGFYGGRYWDSHMVTAQVEYRLPLWWRFGAAAFAGAGDVAAELGELDPLDLKLAGGVGLRYALNPKDRANLRLDFAFSSDGDFNFYIVLGEAF
jgi:outer membrane protein assembly factor BamA